LPASATGQKLPIQSAIITSAVEPTRTFWAGALTAGTLAGHSAYIAAVTNRFVAGRYFEQTVWFYECRSVTMDNECTGGKVSAHASLLIRRSDPALRM
jgi:hypothetical protein